MLQLRLLISFSVSLQLSTRAFVLPVFPSEKRTHTGTSTHRWTTEAAPLATAATTRDVSDIITSTATTTTSTTAANLPAGVQQLEDWLLLRSGRRRIQQDDNIPATIDPNIEHAYFGGGNLRGLKWKGPFLTHQTRVATIPVSKVLRSDNQSGNKNLSWDSELAVRLWNEYRKGSESQYWGYIQLLTNGKANNKHDRPEPVARHALRHWTPRQLEQLQKTSAGQRLLDLHRQQESLWRQKFETVSNESFDHDNNKTMSWDQFAWAMEVVHSRAFLGSALDTTSMSSSSVLGSLAPPVVAAGAGLFYCYNPYALLSNEQPSMVVLVALAVAAALPLVWNAVATTLPSLSPLHNDKSAVLLPLIDSANHKADADSSICFDPVKQCFELIVGPNCVDKSAKQLFISYGPKSDAELLLNFGFVPDMESGSGSDYHQIPTTDQIRHQLATKFQVSNPK